MRRVIEQALVACWAIALLASVQGWSVVGSDLLADGGSSFWTRCGSAMCSCGSQAWAPPGSGSDAGARVAAAIAEHCWAPGEAAPPGEPADRHSAGASWLNFSFVAFGSHRRQHSDGTQAPELTMIPAPVPAGLVGAPARCGDAPRGECDLPPSLALEAPTPPPRAC